jgi:hypothetical protein
VKAVTVRSYSLGFVLRGALWWGFLKIVMDRLMGLIVWSTMLALVAWRAIGVMAERRLCNRRAGRSPFEDDLRRFGVPISSEVISWKTLERLRVEVVAGGGSGVSSSVDEGIWNVNLRVGNEPGIGIGSAVFAAGGTMETPEDLAFSIKGDRSGVSNG